MNHILTRPRRNLNRDLFNMLVMLSIHGQDEQNASLYTWKPFTRPMAIANSASKNYGQGLEGG